MVIALAFAALGAVVGSFVGVVAERHNTGQSYVSGRSRCNSCARPLGARDLVPVLSWVVAGGTCWSCGARVPWQYAALELSLALLFALAYLHLGLTLALLPFLLTLSILAFIVVYDVRHTIVPPEASLLLLLACAWSAWLSAPDMRALGASILSAGLIALFLYLLHVLSGGRAMGLGDAPVVFSLSLLSAPYALSGLLFSFWIGGLSGVLILVLRRAGPRMGIEVPFVPFLAAGYLLAYFIGWNPLALS